MCVRGVCGGGWLVGGGAPTTTTTTTTTTTATSTFAPTATTIATRTTFAPLPLSTSCKDSPTPRQVTITMLTNFTKQAHGGMFRQVPQMMELRFLARFCCEAYLAQYNICANSGYQTIVYYGILYYGVTFYSVIQHTIICKTIHKVVSLPAGSATAQACFLNRRPQ